MGSVLRVLRYGCKLAAPEWGRVLLCLFVLSSPVAVATTHDLTELSLEELLNIEVRLVSRKGDTLRESPAAVYVLNREAIARSGATSIPELLRLVPGVNVTRFAANKWSVNIRGFSDGGFTNRILILLDGRDMFQPAKAGMFWDAVDTLIEDIERIEVVRGPGAALWGANAFNGVINIVTRSAADTQGGLAVLGAGDEEKWIGGLRYGAELAGGHARVFIKAQEQDDMQRLDDEHREQGDNNDGWHSTIAGLRFDRGSNDSGLWSFQLNAYDGAGSEELYLPDLQAAPPHFVTLTHKDVRFSGVSAQLDWQRRYSERSLWSVRAYLDHGEREDLLFDIRVDTFDAEVQHDWRWSAKHRLIWALGFRHTEDELGGDVLRYAPDTRDYSVLSGFAQYEYTQLPDRLRWVLGARMEDNDFSGTELQPNLRVIWTPDERSSYWLASSRANRSPSRIEHDGIGNLDYQSVGGGATLTVSFRGVDSFDAEVLQSHELGWRRRFSERLSLDLALFHNMYEGLRSLEPQSLLPSPNPPPEFVLPVLAGNGLDAKAWGGELLLNAVITPGWQLELQYSHLQVDVDAGNSGDPEAKMAEGVSPTHQATLRSQWQLPRDFQLSSVVRHVSQLDAVDVAEYTELDLVLSRHFGALEVSLVGRNLLDDAHQEYVDGRIGAPRAAVERAAFLKLQYAF